MLILNNIKTKDMNAQDLRIGNYVRFKENNLIYKVITIWEDSIDCESQKDKLSVSGGKIKYFEPILLTEEMLLKCGFNKNYKKGWIGIDVKSDSGITTDFVLAEPLNIGEWQNFYAFVYDSYKFCKLEYLHDLQNLFRDLQKKELEINL